jgi:undecaprenyl-diphosphatase
MKTSNQQPVSSSDCEPLGDRLLLPGRPGRQIILSLLVVIFGIWAFIEIAENLGPDTAQSARDHRVTNWFHAHLRPAVTALAFAITSLGSGVCLATITVASATLFVSRRRYAAASVVMMTAGGGGLLNVILKQFYHRQRPLLDDPLISLASFRFPRGHAMVATPLYGSLTLLAVRFLKNDRWRVPVILAAFVIISAVGWTRIYLGVHYLSDVLSGQAIGAAWLAFSWMTVGVLQRHHASTRNQKTST